MSSTQKPGDSGFFLKYLRAHLTAIIAYALCCLIFAATFALYHLPMKAVLYPVVLSAMVCTGAVYTDICARSDVTELSAI